MIRHKDKGSLTTSCEKMNTDTVVENHIISRYKLGEGLLPS